MATNADKIKEFFRNELTCCICMELFCDPVCIKNCMHRFCKKCLERTFQTGWRTCPLCRSFFVTKRCIVPDILCRNITSVLVDDPSPSPILTNGLDQPPPPVNNNKNEIENTKKIIMILKNINEEDKEYDITKRIKVEENITGNPLQYSLYIKIDILYIQLKTKKFINLKFTVFFFRTSYHGLPSRTSFRFSVDKI